MKDHIVGQLTRETMKQTQTIFETLMQILFSKILLSRKCVTGHYFLAFDCSILNYTSIGVEFHVIEVNPKQIMAPAHVQHIFYVK